jgi:hypothetical protein
MPTFFPVHHEQSIVKQLCEKHVYVHIADEHSITSYTGAFLTVNLNSVVLSPLANYTDRAIAAGQGS